MERSPPQAAALPYRFTASGEVEVLLVTTSANRWTAPKGVIEEGNTPAQTARLEALEEAGVIGAVEEPDLGSYMTKRDGRPAPVRVFALRVDRILPKWQESELRERRWVTPTDAAAMVASEELGLLIESFGRHAAARAKPGRRKRA